MATNETIKWSKLTTTSYAGYVNGCMKYTILKRRELANNKGFTIYYVYEFGNRIISEFTIAKTKKVTQYWENFFATKASQKVGA